MKEDANLAISDGDRLSTGDELDGMCEYFLSQYVLDAFFSVSRGKLFGPDSGIREGIGCEVGELESWISDNGASRHMTSSQPISSLIPESGSNNLPPETEKKASRTYCDWRYSHMPILPYLMGTDCPQEMS